MFYSTASTVSLHPSCSTQQLHSSTPFLYEKRFRSQSQLDHHFAHITTGTLKTSAMGEGVIHKISYFKESRMMLVGKNSKGEDIDIRCFVDPKTANMVMKFYIKGDQVEWTPVLIHTFDKTFLAGGVAPVESLTHLRTCWVNHFHPKDGENDTRAELYFDDPTKRMVIALTTNGEKACAECHIDFDLGLQLKVYRSRKNMMDAIRGWDEISSGRVDTRTLIKEIQYAKG
ncbi:hypothetical protein BCR34DRAFT_592823 [Clohesyomyces aquaticus]|uniref:Uncharacterized protein n=1 Tax=Clohesyomyces aquaticus TaxID=1231657 RepID=A0A1Y1YNT6_9PLEO|nr:hypothetical protein BCR34DRAFT_592823 [Clohesyomyces aquaticus]